MIALQHLSKSFGEKTILRDFSLEFAPGIITALLGPSGCGKTTLLRLAAGLEKPDSGEVLRDSGARLSFVFQEDRLLPWFSALDNLTAAGISRDDALRDLARVGLAGEEHKKPAELSGGMRRRLSIVRALAYGGDFFFLDEPLQGLDPGTASSVLSLLRQRLEGKTGLLITHNPEEALALAGQIVIIAGPPVRIVQGLPRAEVESPQALRALLETAG